MSDISSSLKVFWNPELSCKVRSLLIDGEPWFVGIDVANALGYVVSRDALKKHVDVEDKLNAENSNSKIEMQNASQSKNNIFIHDSLGRKKYPILINESGLYSLILNSKQPYAKKFKRWVTSEMIPSVRKTGIYMTKEAADDYKNNPSNFEQRFQRFEEALNEQKQVNSQLIGLLKQANNNIMLLDRQVRAMKPAETFLRLYGNDSESRTATFYANELGLSCRKFNLVLVSFGILGEHRTKNGKNIHRFAQDYWKKIVRTQVRSFEVEAPDLKNGSGLVKKEIRVTNDLSSPGWFPEFLPNIITYFQRFKLVDKRGKFLEDVWDKARKEETKRYRKMGKLMPLAWAREYFKQFDSRKPDPVPFDSEKYIFKDQSLLIPPMVGEQQSLFNV